MTNPNHLVALQFDSALRANEFVAAAVRMQSEGHLLVSDAVFITKDADGTAFVTETTDLSTGSGAMSGAVWGGLFGILLAVPIAGLAIGAGLGALAAKSTDIGVSDEFVESMRATVEPGKTVLVMMASHVNDTAVLDELKRFPGVKLVASDLSPDAIEVVNAVLEDAK